MESTVQSLKNQVKKLQFVVALSLLVSLGLGILMGVSKSQSSKILRTQGIIITDAQGKDRILIGSPIPFSTDRVRTDSAKAWNAYVQKYPEDYQEQVWNWYKDYNHATNGIVFLSDSGFDRLILGDPTPDPAVGKRMLPGTGMVINDEQGYERSGYGIMKTEEGNYRVALGMDSKNGQEGVMLQVDDLGGNGLIIPGQERFIFLGNSDTTFFLTQPFPKYNGLLIRSMDSVFVDIR